MPARSDRILAAGELVAGAALALMVAHIGADVAMQALFDRPLRGTSEIVSELYMPFIVFCALAVVQRRKEEIRVDIICMVLPASVAALLDRAVQIVVTATAFWLAWYTGEQAIDAFRINERIELATTAIPSWPGKAILPAGFVLLGLAAIDRALRP